MITLYATPLRWRVLLGRTALCTHNESIGCKFPGSLLT